jgi:hypothetical protein
VGESIILKSCYIEALKLAVANNCSSVAFPLISSGTYGYPKDQVLRFAIQVITEFLYDHELMVYLCVFDRTSYEFSKTLFSEISEAIDDEIIADCEDHSFSRPFEIESAIYCDEAVFEERTCNAPQMAKACYPCSSVKSSVDNKTLEEYMKAMDKSFAYKLFDLIDERGMTDVECYKKANVDKKTFSKIKCNPDIYKPSKQTAVAFAIALNLNLDETQDLLASAGLTLSRSFKFDKIIRYFIQKEIYDIFLINEALFEFDQVLLGC